MSRRAEWIESAARLKTLGLGLACLALAGCGGGGTPQTFDLTAPISLAARAARGQMVVAEPVATAPADSDRIVVRTAPEAVAYLTGAQWADRLPRVIQTKLIETFENAHLLKSVGRPGLSADYSLATEIRRFEIDVTTGMAIAEFSVKLVGDRSGRIVAARIFTASSPSPTSGPPAMTAALNQALGMVLRQIVAWASGQV